MPESMITKEDILHFAVEQVGADNVIKVLAFTMAGTVLSFIAALYIFPNKSKKESK